MTEETTTTETETNPIVGAVVIIGAVTAGAATLYTLKRRFDRKRDEKNVAIMMEEFNKVFANMNIEEPAS